ncbi:NAD(P)/FAD-dependent oxidoreductase [Dryocola sp. BD586]|jgi:thioredoxin reductase|uniref:NAD(P)/FAD-dependent oxidoreductase n=1 Tax=Dryocola sp. BD586 TaxID=3133271 RepID=UPI003F50A80F
MSDSYDVIIIGAGPAGLAVARSLQEAGTENVLLIEREAEAGGVPRHCRHPTFGLLTEHRPMQGHVWAKKLVAAVRYPLRTSTTVTKLLPGGVIEVVSDSGAETLRAKKVVLATGVRETPRHPRLVGGLRPQGVLTAGALQQFVYLRGLKPGNAPVIVGSELVSFSALWTLRNAGVRPVAMIEEGRRPIAWRYCTLFARLLGVPVYFNHHVSRIVGLDRVEGVELTGADGTTRQLACDSVIFTGRFTGEYTLIRSSHLDYNPRSGLPLFDQFGACSDPAYYAVGNMTHPADMGDRCYQEGRRLGEIIARELVQPAAAGARILVAHGPNIRSSAPNIVRQDAAGGWVDFNIRVDKPVTGVVMVREGDKVLYRRRHRCMPERRIMLKRIPVPELTGGREVTITLDE